MSLLAALSGPVTIDSRGSEPPAAERDGGLLLLPLPAALTLAEGALAIDQRFTVSFDGDRDPLLDGAVARLVERLRARTGIPITPTPIASGTGTLQIRCGKRDPAFLTGKADERYTLDVTTERATIAAPTSTGVLRALATFAQLVRADGTGVHARAVHIEDAPRFAWRGLMLDVARHFAGPAVLHRTLDAMESVKLNVLHLHLSDNEGFRLESLRYPRLHATPSSGGQFYTRADVRATVAAARDRGIRVVPELEMPGHSQSILIAYPQLGAGPGPYRPGRSLDMMNAALDPTRETIYTFIAGLLTEMVWHLASR